MTFSPVPPLAAVTAALAAPEAEERRQATASLALLPAPDAIPLLLRALGDEDWRVRKEATFAARSLGPQPALLSALLRSFEPSENVGLRNAAVEVLATFGHPATTAVADAFDRLDADGRKLVVDVLGRSRDPGALEPLQRALRDSDSNVRQAAIEAIAGLGALCPEPVQAVLLEALESRDAFVRMTALEGLNALGVSVPWKQLAPLMEDATMRGAAVSAAALSDSEEAPRAVAYALASARGAAFGQALAALTRLAEGAAAPLVKQALRAQGAELGARLVQLAMGGPSASISPEATSTAGGSSEGAVPSSDQQRCMALALAALARAPGAVEAALTALSEEPFVEAAQRALVALGPSVLPEVLERLAAKSPAHSQTSGGLRAALIDVLTAVAHHVGWAGGATETGESARVPWPRVLAALRAAVRDKDRRVATSALVALSRLGHEDDLELAAELTGSSSASVAHSAETSLAALAQRFPRAARALVRTERQHGPLSLNDAVVLGALATTPEAKITEDDVAMLAHAVTAGDERTRRAAVAAVGEVGGASSFEILGFALADEERDVQLAAARAFGRLCTETSHARPPIRDALELVTRSGDPDLIAVLVRAIGEGAGSSGAVVAASELVEAIGPLAADPTSPIAMAAVDALGRTPSDAPGRQDALVQAADHADAAVVRAALLKLAGNAAGLEEIARRLDHPSPEIRILAAEILGSPSHFPAGEAVGMRARLSHRVTVEADREVRDAIEGALAALKRHGGVPTS